MSPTVDATRWPSTPPAVYPSNSTSTCAIRHLAFRSGPHAAGGGSRQAYSSWVVPSCPSRSNSIAAAERIRGPEAPDRAWPHRAAPPYRDLPETRGAFGMRVLLVGVGGVGEAIALMARDRPWLERMVLADYNTSRAREVRRRLDAPRRFPVEGVDAGNRRQIVELARKHRVDLVMNAVDPVFDEAVFDAAYQAGANYMDMAMTLSRPDRKSTR